MTTQNSLEKVFIKKEEKFQREGNFIWWWNEKITSIRLEAAIKMLWIYASMKIANLGFDNVEIIDKSYEKIVDNLLKVQKKKKCWQISKKSLATLQEKLVPPASAHFRGKGFLFSFL